MSIDTLEQSSLERHDGSEQNTTPELGPSGEAIQRLEQSKLLTGEKMDILLVELGLKPANTHRFDSDIWFSGEEPQQINEKAFEDYLEVIRDAGLLIEVGPDLIVNPVEEITRGTDGEVMMTDSDTDWEALINEGQQRVERKVYIARTAEDLERVKLANETNDARLYGQSYGFPNSAIDAYVSNTTVSPDLVDGMTPEVRAFAQYGFSESNAPDEIATAQQWHDAVLDASPVIYKEVIDYSLD